MKNFKYRPVAVLWEDACSEGGWQEEKDVSMEPVLVTTIGFLVKKTRKHVLIASSLQHDDHMINDLSKIPVGMVKEIRDIAITK